MRILNVLVLFGLILSVSALADELEFDAVTPPPHPVGLPIPHRVCTVQVSPVNDFAGRHLTATNVGIYGDCVAKIYDNMPKAHENKQTEERSSKNLTCGKDHCNFAIMPDGRSQAGHIMTFAAAKGKTEGGCEININPAVGAIGTKGKVLAVNILYRGKCAQLMYDGMEDVQAEEAHGFKTKRSDDLSCSLSTKKDVETECDHSIMPDGTMNPGLMAVPFNTMNEASEGIEVKDAAATLIPGRPDVPVTVAACTPFTDRLGHVPPGMGAPDVVEMPGAGTVYAIRTKAFFHPPTSPRFGYHVLNFLRDGGDAIIFGTNEGYSAVYVKSIRTWKLMYRYPSGTMVKARCTGARNLNMDLNL